MWPDADFGFKQALFKSPTFPEPHALHLSDINSLSYHCEQGLSTLYIHVHNSAVHGHLIVDATWVSTGGQLCKHTVLVNVCSRVSFSLEKKGEADVCTQG